jgi:hypothetical protein
MGVVMNLVGLKGSFLGMALDPVDGFGIIYYWNRIGLTLLGGFGGGSFCVWICFFFVW